MTISVNSSRWPNSLVPSRSVSDGSIQRSRLVSDMTLASSFSARISGPRSFARLYAPAHQGLEHAGLRTIGDHLAAIQHDQAVDQRQHRMAVGDQDDGLAARDRAQALLERGLG